MLGSTAAPALAIRLRDGDAIIVTTRPHDEAEMASSDTLRDELLAWIDGRGAHMPFDAAVTDFPDEAINRLPPNVSYTPWHLVEHIRRTQADLLAYIRQDGYVAPEWPTAYWPAEDAKATPAEFARSVGGFKADQAALRKLVADPATDLLATIPNTPGHTILREVRLSADHTAYHVGELASLRQVMGTWPPDRDKTTGA